MRKTGAKHILLLTGPPGVGKTTVVRRVAAELGARRIRGFTTEEIREDQPLGLQTIRRRSGRPVHGPGVFQHVLADHVCSPCRHPR